MVRIGYFSTLSINRKFFSLLIFLFFFKASLLFGEGKAHIWNNFGYARSISPKLDVKIFGENRFRNNMNKWWYSEVGVGLKSKISDAFSFGLTSSSVRLQLGGIVFTELRPTMDFHLNHKINKLNFNGRVRNELRLFYPDEQKSNSAVYRLRIRGGINYSVDDKIQLFANEEVLYGTESKSFEQNRLFIGFKLHFKKNTLAIAWGLLSSSPEELLSMNGDHLIYTSLYW